MSEVRRNPPGHPAVISTTTGRRNLQEKGMKLKGSLRLSFFKMTDRKK